jgi:hypothetical protein
MLQAGVILVAIGLLFALAALALGAVGMIGRPLRVAVALAVTLVAGIALLLE